MKVDLIVTSRDNHQLVLRLLESLTDQKKYVKIIFINQNEESYSDILYGFDYVEIMARHLPLSKARNLGLIHCTEELVGFPDDDCWYEKDFFNKLLSYFTQNPDFDIACTSVYDPLARRTYGRRPLNLECDVNYSNILDLPISVGIFIRRARHQEEIHFNERLGAGTVIGSGEETCLLLDLFSKSAKIKYNGYLRVFHQIPKSEPNTKIFNYAIGYGFSLRTLYSYDKRHGLHNLMRILFRCLILYCAFLCSTKRKKFGLRFLGVIKGFKESMHG